MFYINKITSNSTVDYAADELKKYLRMMMPNGGDVKISYVPKATDGFRLGLMQDFGLDVSDAADTVLDDIIYIDTDENGGIIAGDNPRSVLLAVYEYLRQNGCRWLFPGVDGEYVPMKSVTAVKYRHKPSCRYRGPCIEGACSQEMLLETIDFVPKVGMNVFMMQFLVPTVFYDRYYNHIHNSTRKPETLSQTTMLQWKTMCEAEMSKRGIEFHDVGHGWTVAPFGVNTAAGWDKIDDSTVPDDGRQYLAKFNGVRKLYEDVALNTQFCMSSPEARKKVAEYIADYAEIHSNVDYIHVWLGDNYNNHCECEECAKKSVSDWYVMLLNEIDKALAAKKLSTRIVFIVYTETTWAPLAERIDNPDRFTLMLAPITRSYTRTLTDKKCELPTFVRNKAQLPADLDEYMTHYKEWRKIWKGSALCYEYHFWKHQIFDPSGLLLAKRVFEDIEAYKSNGVDGLIACGSQRSYFPTGFAYYVFARKQYDISLSFEDILNEYFSAAFGEDYKQFINYLYEVADIFGDKYLEGEESADVSVDVYYNPERAKKLRRATEVVAKGRELIKAYPFFEERVRTKSVRLLEEHADYFELLAKAFEYKANGDKEKIKAAYDALEAHLNSREVYIEKYFEHYIAMWYIGWLLLNDIKESIL